MEGRVVILLLLLVWQNTFLHLVGADDSVVFPDSITQTNKTQSQQPNGSSNHEDSKANEEAKPRFGFHTGGTNTALDFGIQPDTGGISGSASFSSSYGGQGQNQGSQSQSFNFQSGSNGFSVSHTASQASSFNTQSPGNYGFGAPSISGSQASSQAAIISGSAGGGGSGSAASSQASSFGFRGSGAGVGVSSSSANSQIFSSSLVRPGDGYGYYPVGGMSASSSQSAGASFGGTGSYSNENLTPDFNRHSQRGYKCMNNYGCRKRPRWSGQVIALDKNSAVTYPE